MFCSPQEYDPQVVQNVVGMALSICHVTNPQINFSVNDIIWLSALLGENKETVLSVHSTVNILTLSYICWARTRMEDVADNGRKHTKYRNSVDCIYCYLKSTRNLRQYPKLDRVCIQKICWTQNHVRCNTICICFCIDTVYIHCVSIKINNKYPLLFSSVSPRKMIRFTQKFHCKYDRFPLR